jgi:2-oxoglutarate dehydrogenase E2 component (dihydrolipoamide succinyltransferase)
MLQWKKKAGEAVTADEILIEIETDKVVLEVPAPASGVLTEIIQHDGATVVAEQLIAKIDTVAVASAAPAKAAPAPCRCRFSACRCCRQPSSSAAGFAMPAAQKILADNNPLPPPLRAQARTVASPKAMLLQAAQAS